MNRVPTSVRFVLAVLIASLCVFVPSVGADEPETGDPLDQIVANLQSTNFFERTSAQKSLTEIASGRIEDLARAAVVADQETAERIVQVLESIFLSDAGEAGELAEIALEALQFSGRSGSVAAGKVLHGNSRLRESRARKAIESLGGEFVYFKPLAQEMGQYYFESKFSILPVRGVGVGFGEPAVLLAIYLHEDWKGTEEDLWHFRRLAHQRDIVLYSIRGNSIPIEQLLVMARFIRGLSVQERGACLGIQSSADGLCEVKKVVTGGAADQAGLKEADIVTQLNEIRIRSFPHLVEELASRKKGDKVTLQVYRNSALQNVEVTLGSWRDVSQKSEKTALPPRPFGGPLHVLSEAEMRELLNAEVDQPISPVMAPDDTDE